MLMWILSSCVLLSTLALLVQILRLGMAGRVGENVELSTADMQRHLMWRSFYVNPDDSRGWVPKMYGYGWTVNFRTRKSVHVFIVFVSISLIGALLATAAALTACGCF